MQQQQRREGARLPRASPISGFGLSAEQQWFSHRILETTAAFAPRLAGGKGWANDPLEMAPAGPARGGLQPLGQPLEQAHHRARARAPIPDWQICQQELGQRRGSMAIFPRIFLGDCAQIRGFSSAHQSRAMAPTMLNVFAACSSAMPGPGGAPRPRGCKRRSTMHLSTFVHNLRRAASLAALQFKKQKCKPVAQCTACSS